MSGGVATVGRLAVSVTGDVDGLKTAMTEAQSVVGAAAKDMAVNVSAVSDSTDKVTAAGQRMVAALQEEVRTFGMSREEILIYKASLTGAGAEVERLVGQLQSLRAAQAAAPQLSADANATQRIRDMVAASVAQTAAMNESAGAAQNLTTAQAGAARVAASWADSQRLQAQNMTGVTASMRAASAGTQELSAQTQSIMNRYDPLGTKLRALQSDLAVLRKEMGNSVDPAAMRAFQGLEAEIDKTRSLMAKAGVEGFGAMEEGAKKGGVATAGATRELIVLGHEAMNGNFSKMPGSFLVLASRMGFLMTLINPTTLGFVALGAAAAGVAAAISSGHDQMVAMNNAMLVTSNYAGMSRQSMDQLAESMTRTHEVTIGTANAIVLALVNSGRIGSDSINQIAHFISDFAKSTGQSVDEIAPKMVSMFEDPIKGAQELNSSMHFLTTTQIEHIAALERTGQVQAAQAELAKAASDHMPKQAQNIGVVTAALLEQRDAWSKLGAAIMAWGAKRDQPDQQAQDLRDQISEYLARGLTRQSPAVIAVQAQLDALEPAIQKQKELTQAQKDAAAANELQAKSWDAVKASSTAYHIEELRDRLKLIEAHKSEAGPDFAAQEAAKRDAIRKTNDEIIAAQRSIGQEDRQLTQQQLTDGEQYNLLVLQGQAKRLDSQLKLGVITKEQFDASMTVNSTEQNAIKQNYELQMSQVAGLTTAERQGHLDKLKYLQEEASQITDGGKTSVAIDNKNSYDAIAKTTADYGAAAIKSLDDQILKQREHNAEIGKTKEQIELARQAQVDLATVQLQSDADYLRDGLAKWTLDDKSRGIIQMRLTDLDEEIKRRRVLAGLHADGADLEAQVAAVKAADVASKQLAAQAIQDWRNAGSSIADSLSSAFGTGGKALGQMFRAYADGMAGQLKAQKELAEAKTKLDTDPTKIAAINAAQLQGVQAQVKSYGDMAQAAQGFFTQGSTGYKAMAAATDVLRVAEIGLSLVKGVNAVLTQGEGDPYSAFGRMAAMAAIVAGLGVALSGGGGSAPSAAQRQAAQGTGTILGDSNAKSDSIAKSIELSAVNSSTQINYLADMRISLKGIETNIGAFASQIVQSTGISNPNVHLNTNNGGATSFLESGTLFGAILAKAIPGLGNLFGKIATSIFGGKQTLNDSGFTLDPTSLGAAMSGGVSAKSYADITTSGGWFSSDKTSTQTTALSASADQQITLIIKSLADSVKQAGSLLGESGDDFTNKLNSFVVDIGKVSLKGLSGADQQKALEAVFSKLGDQMAQWVVGGLEPFEQVGEGYLQTLVRVASDYAKVDASLQSIDMTFGTVGISSVAARESLIALAGGIDQFQSQTASFAKDFLTQSEQLAPVAKFVDDQLAALGLSGITTRDAFKQVVLGLDLTTDAGQKQYAALMGLESAFAATHAAIVDATKSEQQIADERKSLQDKLDEATMTSIQLRDKERATIDASNVALYDQVQAAQRAKDIATERATLQDQYDQLTMTSTQLAQKQRDALDDSNRALFDQVQALQTQKAAIQAQKDAATGLLGDVDSAFTVLQNVTKVTTDAISARITAEQALSSAIKSTLSGMKATSTDLTDRAAAQAQIKAALAISKAGGPLPTADSLQGALSVVSQDASAKFATVADYLKDLYSTKNDLAQLGDLADSALSVDQKQLNTLNDQLKAAQKQVDLLKGIDTTGLSIQQALAGFQTAITAAKANPIVAATSAIGDQYHQSLGRAPDAAGLAYWQQQAASGVPLGTITGAIATSPEATINGMYETMLGHTPDPAGLQFWLTQLKNGTSLSDIGNAIAGSAEARTKVPGFASGGDFAGGLRIVGENGPELEATGPARIFNANQTSSLLSRLSSPSSNNDALLTEVRALRQEVSALRVANSAENIAIAKSSAKSAEALDGAVNGVRPLVTATQ